MLFLWLIAIVLGILALWLAFWVLLILAALVQMGFKAVALNQAEARCPGIKARFEKIEAIRNDRRAKIEAHNKHVRKSARAAAAYEWSRTRERRAYEFRGAIGAAGS